MVPEKIQLRKIRDFSSTFSDVLQFIKQEFKPFIKSILFIGGIFILLSGIFGGLTYGTSNIFSEYSYSNVDMTYQSAGITSLNFLLFFISIALTQAVIMTTIGCYLKLYEQNGNVSPSFENVWNTFKQYIMPIIGYAILIYVIVCIGCIFCLIPGVYLAVVLAPFSFIIIFEDNKNMGYVFNRCFELIKENFWPSIGLYLVAGIICSTISSMIGLIFGAGGGLISYFTTHDVSSAFGWGYGILMIFSSLVIFLVYLAVAFNYFSLTEKKDATGLYDRINQLGNDTPTIPE